LDLEYAIAHCNFALRGTESDLDEDFVRQYAETQAIQGYFQKFDTEAFAADHKVSIQMAARTLRYQWFDALAETHGYDYILTAHHLDDQIETFLINFTRGTGIDGLLGIPVENQKIVRPMLEISSVEIEKYAAENNILWREDSSNASDKYMRNAIRHQVVPVIKKLNPQFDDTFLQTLANLKQTKSRADDASVIVYKKVVESDDNQKIISLDALSQISDPDAYLYEWLSPLGFQDWDAIYDLKHAQSGKQVFAKDFVLLKNRNQLILAPIQVHDNSIFTIDSLETKLNIPLKLSFKKVNKVGESTANSIFVDGDLLRFPLTLRKWLPGDVFYPQGMIGKKKLSKFFKDEKMSIFDKSETWVLCADHAIVWVVGKRMDNRFSITNQTKNIVQINRSS